jgi:hypothetical protein
VVCKLANVSAAVNVAKDHQVVALVLEEFNNIFDLQAISNFRLFRSLMERWKHIPLVDGDMKMILSK